MQRGTPTTSENPISEKAKAFFAIARELIDLCDANNRMVILAFIQSTIATANDCDALKGRDWETTEEDREREKAWAAYYADYGKGE